MQQPEVEQDGRPVGQRPCHRPGRQPRIPAESAEQRRKPQPQGECSPHTAGHCSPQTDRQLLRRPPGGQHQPAHRPATAQGQQETSQQFQTRAVAQRFPGVPATRALRGHSQRLKGHNLGHHHNQRKEEYQFRHPCSGFFRAARELPQSAAASKPPATPQHSSVRRPLNTGSGAASRAGRWPASSPADRWPAGEKAGQRPAPRREVPAVPLAASPRSAGRGVPAAQTVRGRTSENLSACLRPDRPTPCATSRPGGRRGRDTRPLRGRRCGRSPRSPSAPPHSGRAVRRSARSSGPERRPGRDRGGRRHQRRALRGTSRMEEAFSKCSCSSTQSATIRAAVCGSPPPGCAASAASPVSKCALLGRPGNSTSTVIWPQMALPDPRGLLPALAQHRR